jgi:phospholipase C
MSGNKRGGRRGLTRRQFIKGAAAVAGGAALPGCGGDVPQPASSGGTPQPSTGGVATLPRPEDSGIDHVVVVMLENRSFDHFLGWVPGADGKQAGIRQVDRNGVEHESFDMAPDYQGCHLSDPDHTYEGGHAQINGGAMDSFLLTQPTGDLFPIGYYTADSLPFFKGCAENWTICDRYFSGLLGLTTPNRFYMHAGQTDRNENSVAISTLPTIWDRMLEAGKSVAYYYTDVSYTSFWGDKYKSFSKKYTMSSFAADIAAGPLPTLMFVDNVGNTLNEGGAISIDDHPYADIRDGQAFLNAVYNALRANPSWERTLMIINYDEWGGFYDHVPPPLAPISAEEAALGNDGRLGCRVPCVLLGPRVKRGHVEHMQIDPNSILNMLAWRFGFAPLGVRTDSNNLALALDFANAPNPSAPAFEVAEGPFGGICFPGARISSLVGLPAPLPSVGPVPLPVNLQFPSIPGFDVPVTQPDPTFIIPLLQAQVRAVEARQAAHEAEMEALRQLGRQFGF